MLRFLFVSIFFQLLCIAHGQTNVYNEGLTTFKETKNGKTKVGFKDKSGKVIIPARYDSIANPFYSGIAIVVVNNLYGTIDNKGKSIIPVEYKKIIQPQFDLTPIENNLGYWGFYSIENKLVIPCSYNNFKFTNKGKQIFVQKDGKWGMISPSNAVLVPFEYKTVESISPKQVRGTRFNNWVLFSPSGEAKKKYEYDSVLFTQTDLLSYNQNGWYGLLEKNGTIALPNICEDIGDIESNFVATKKNGQWGVKKLGAADWIIDPVYDIIRMDSLMIYAAITFGNNSFKHWRMFDYTGRPIYNETIVDYHEIQNGLMAVKSNTNRWGFINEKGQQVIPFQYTTVSDFNLGLCRVEKNGEQLVINKIGDVVLNHQDVYLYSIGLLKLNAFQDKTYTYSIDATTEIIPINETFIKTKNGLKYGLINTKGETVLPIQYSDIQIGTSLKTIAACKDKIWKVIPIGGKPYPVDKRIVSIEGFYDEMAIMKYSNGKYGCIDNHGEIRVAPQYDQVRPFGNGVAVVLLNGKWGIINKSESWVAQPYYEYISDFKNGVAVVKEKGIYYLIHTSGKILTPEGYSSITLTAGGNYVLVKNKLNGIANANGKEIISPRYQSIVEFTPSLFKVTENNLTGVIDANRKIILHIKYTEVLYNSRTKEFLAAENGVVNLVTVK